MTVLILTAEQDVTADMVVARLHEQGVPMVRLDPADVPGRAVLSADYAHGDFDGYRHHQPTDIEALAVCRQKQVCRGQCDLKRTRATWEDWLRQSDEGFLLVDRPTPDAPVPPRSGRRSGARHNLPSTVAGRTVL